MWTAIVNAIAAVVPAVLKLFGGGSSTADQRELGRAEQQTADLKAGNATMRAATEAAQKAESQPEPEHDQNDRSLRR